ncbi:MAG: tRNA pseudouridine(38-40) synthase TruA, partial [Clostridia bacterium]|nr:tRNA pseudouridine(38-40) synthase TruA [Clostridia bacterium]
VHALHQTAHFDLSVPISEEKIAQILNDHLPPDIVITNAKEVDGDFHARFSIKKKTYLYKIHSSKDKFAFEAYHFGFIKQPLDEEKMREVAKLLIGTHDFKGFCSSQTSATDFTRTIYDISVERVDENNINIFVTGSGFLYNMVRIIVGTMVDYSLGKVTLDQIKDALENGNRSSAGRTMPASGLYLYNTEY